MVAALGLNPKEGMSPVAIRDLFSALDDALSSTAEPVSVLIVGGAAISLQWNAAPRNQRCGCDIGPPTC